MTDPIRIVAMTANNVMSLEAVEMRLDGEAGLVRVSGKNGAGKSTVLDLIPMALTGKGAVPQVPIRKGEDAADLEIVTTNGLKIRRTFTEKGTYLHVTDADGMKGSQSILERLLGKGASIDPHRFMRMPPRHQADQIVAMMGLDLKEHDVAIQAAYDERTTAGRDAVMLQQQAETAKQAVPADAPTVEPPSTTEAVQELLDRQNHNATNKRAREHVGYLVDKVKEAQAKLNDRTVDHGHVARLATQRITKAREELEAATDAKRELKAEIEREQAELGAAETIARAEVDKATSMAEALRDRDVDEARQALAMLESLQQAWRARVNSDAAEVAASEAKDYHRRTEAAVDEMREARRDAIAAADLPVAGLDVRDGQVWLHDLPFAQASTSEQLRVSMALEMARSPDFRVITFSDASLLDETSLAMVEEMARGNGYQVFVELVSDHDGVMVNEAPIEKEIGDE